MKNVLLFLLFLFIGTVGTFIATKTIHVQKVKPLETPLSKTSAFSLENAPSESMRGSIISFSGQIAWQSRIATQTAVITTKREIQQGESIETKKAGQMTVEFPSVSKIILSQNTLLEIIQTLPTSFALHEDHGTVEYIKTGTIPFSVRTQHVLIKQPTGDMIVTSDPDTAAITITVNKGSAILGFNDTDNTSQVVTLSAGDVYTYDDDSRTGKLQ